MEEALDPMKRSTLQHLFSRAASDALLWKVNCLVSLTERGSAADGPRRNRRTPPPCLIDRPGDALHAIAERIAARRGDRAAGWRTKHSSQSDLMTPICFAVGHLCSAARLKPNDRFGGRRRW